MTKKEVQAAIDANPKAQIYLQYGTEYEGIGYVGMFEPASKTTVLRNAKIITRFIVDTYRALRPDLERYFASGRMDGTETVIAFICDEPKPTEGAKAE